MNSTTTLEKFESLARYYLEELEKYSLEQLRTKPSAEEWSLGQMYNHLLSATYMQLDAIEKCKTETPFVANNKTDMGEKVYILGAFPDIQIKVPEHPGLGYLNAAEWFQLISMHFAHHLRQKSRLETEVLV
ncbi:hypothetical protein COI73_19775 [Bacillus cereus]|nr:hypothetical protein COI73_19775 [Bacillus cereus]